MTILQTLTTPTTAPSRTQDKDTFNTNVDNRLAWQETNVTEMAQVIVELNATAADINADEVSAAASALTAAEDAATATAQAAVAVAAANFAGTWSLLTGALAVPASVSHNGALWLLLDDVADVTASEPGVDPEWGALSGIVMETRTANTIIGPTDSGKLLRCTTTGYTQTAQSVTLLGDAFQIVIWNDSTGDLTIGFACDGLAGFVMYPGEKRSFFTNGTDMFSTVLKSFSKTYTSSGSFTPPPGYTLIEVDTQAGGGGGGGGARITGGVGASGGGGGGGGAFKRMSHAPSTIAVPETVTVAAGGTAGTGATVDNTGGTGGGNGGNSSFGSLQISYGGGGGLGGDVGGTSNGGGYGGLFTAASSSTPGTPTATLNLYAASGGASSEVNPASAGLSTLNGGPGGGAGGGITTANTPMAGAAGGNKTGVGATGGGAAGGAATGVAGTAGSSGSGAGGGGASSGSAGGAGGAGSLGSGGGGGGTALTAFNGGAGGAGGAGYVTVRGIL